MSKVVVTLKIMPESPQVNLELIEKEAAKILAKFGCEIGKKEINPIAFGINALMLMFLMDESKGSTEKMEEKLAEIPGVNSVTVEDVRRTLG